MLHWEKIIDIEDLSINELKQIPSENITYYCSALKFYKKRGWDLGSLVEGTGLRLNDFSDFSKWINPIQSERLGRNFFKNAPEFLPHTAAYQWGLRDFSDSSILTTVIKYTPFKNLVDNAVRSSSKLENSFEYSVKPVSCKTYGMRIRPKNFKKNRVFGYETSAAMGYLETIHRIKNIGIRNIKNFCDYASIKVIISYFYDDHNFTFTKNEIFNNGRIIAKKVKAMEIESIRELYPWKVEDRVYLVVDDYEYMGEKIFSKGDVYNAPFSYFTWSVSGFSLMSEKIRNLIFYYVNRTVPELEYQIRQNSRKSQDMLQMASLLDIEKSNKELFMANIVHEIKSPLASIVMLLDSMESHIPGELKEIKEGFLHLEDKSTRLINFVDNVMSYFSMDNNNFILNRERIDIGMVIDDVLDNFSHLALEGSVVLSHYIPKGKFYVNGDYYRLLQVFLNLVNNSVKFTRKGRILVNAYREEKNVVISVMDTGIGILAEKIDKIFDMFELNNSCKNHNGLGLGLYISKSIINRHNGDIEVFSKPGEGSDFRVSIPAMDQE